MLEMLAGFLGGMGMFFTGLKMTGDGLRGVAGRRFRARFLRWTRSLPSASLLGFLSGVLFQSTSGLSLLLASLVGVGAATVANALPVLIGANAGVASLVLMAVVDIKVLILLTLGLSGLALSFERPVRLARAAGIMFGVGLLLLGLQTVRLSAAPLAQTPWFQGMLSGSDTTLPAFFGAGALACFLLQTAAGVSILAITFAASGLITGENALVIIYGSLLGSSLLARVYAVQLQGARKRLVMGQVFFNLTGLAIFLPVFAFEKATGIPVLLGLASRLFDGLGNQLTFLRILFDCVTALALLAVLPAYLRLLERLFPDAPDMESLTHMRELSGLSPDTALLVVSSEQNRLARCLPGYLDRLRRSLDNGTPLKAEALHQGVAAQLKEIDEGLRDVAETIQESRQAECIALVQDSQAMFKAANDALKDLAEVIAAAERPAALERLGRAVMEGLDLILILAAEALDSNDAENWSQFYELCRDKGPAMQRLRARYLGEECAVSPEERWQLLRMTSLFERLVWIVRHIALSQQRVRDALGTGPSAGAAPNAD